MTEQNDKPGTVVLNGSGPNPSPNYVDADHVDLLPNGWVMCRNGTHGKDAEVTFYPAHRVARIDRETDDGRHSWNERHKDTDVDDVTGYTDNDTARSAAINAAKGSGGPNGSCVAYHALHREDGVIELYKIADVIETDQ